MREQDLRDRDLFTIVNSYSPHRSRRMWRPWLKPRVALVHATVSGTLHGTVGWLQNPKSKVSYDFVIDKDGRIARCVPPGYLSWHAGECWFMGKKRKDYNWISYGIGLVNWNDGKDPYPERQLRAMALIIARIQLEAPTVALIRRHEDVVTPVGRKTDPAGLSIKGIYKAVQDWQPGVELD